jgi:hypothetical protein
MSIERELNKRSGSKCDVGRRKPEGVRTTTKKKEDWTKAMTCTTCKDQIENPGNEFEPLEMQTIVCGTRIVLFKL